jgi:hypothetical protein
MISQNANEQLQKARAALDAIENRIGEYIESGSAIPASAVSGNSIMPSLADQLEQCRDAILALEAEVTQNEKDQVAKNLPVDSEPARG